MRLYTLRNQSRCARVHNVSLEVSQMATVEQTFEEAIAEYIEKSREQFGVEIMENIPPWLPAPFEQGPPPFEAAMRLDRCGRGGRGREIRARGPDAAGDQRR